MAYTKDWHALGALQITNNERRIWETVNIHLSNPKLEVDPVPQHHQGTHYLYFLRELYFKCITWKVKSLSRVWLFATPWSVAYQAPQSTEFSSQEYWSGLPFPSLVDEVRKVQINHPFWKDIQSGLSSPLEKGEAIISHRERWGTYWGNDVG